MTLTPEQVQPGALNEQGEGLRISHPDGFEFAVVDRFQAGRGSYLIAGTDESPALFLLPEAVALEECEPVSAPDPRDDENAELRARIAELERQQQDQQQPAPAPDEPPDPDTGGSHATGGGV